MSNLFDESDFALFEQYAGRKSGDAPEGHEKLKKVYDKLGLVGDELKRRGYPTDIIRNPQNQGGKYSAYHWSQIYPKDKELFHEIEEIMFVVLGTLEKGLYLHIGFNTTNKNSPAKAKTIAKAIKDKTWIEYPLQVAAQYTCEEIADIVEEYYKEHWVQFNEFAKEIGIKRSQEILNNMELDKIKKLLVGNHNLILTGAPGTGKTYMAKKIAEAMGAEWKLVQFHPSYDYTDFVEGLRPMKKENQLGFERKDGVFKAFCKEAINSRGLQADQALEQFKKDLSVSQPIEISCFRDSSRKIRVQLNDEGAIKVYPINSKKKNCYPCPEKSVLTYLTTGEYDEKHDTYPPSVGEYIRKKYSVNAVAPSKPYVFIIDEINRGEISKIFGELFYSIDPGYRGEKGKVMTQYQNLVPQDDTFFNGFYIPENVYIIGTMNDIDRSVESMDFAMRRRFAWKEITASSRQSMLDEAVAWNGKKPTNEVIQEMKNRMNNLNACIIDQYQSSTNTSRDRIGLTKAYQIGASYFLKYGLYGNFDDLWENHLKGLLYEYLRGTTDIETKITRLHEAYKDTEAH
jgi:hypothetical protein